MRRHSMYERDGPPRYRPHMPPQRYGPPMMRGGPMHRGPFMSGGGHRDMYHPYNAPRPPPYHRRDDFDKDIRDRRASNDRRSSTAYDGSRNYPLDRQDSRDGRRGSELRRESPPPPLLRNPPEYDSGNDSNSGMGWDTDDRDPTGVGFPTGPPPEPPRSVPNEPPPMSSEPHMGPPSHLSPRQPPIPPPGPPPANMPPPATPLAGPDSSGNSPAILPTPNTMHPIGSHGLLSSASAPLLSNLPQSGMSSPLLGTAPPMAAGSHSTPSSVGFQNMSNLPASHTPMQQNMFNNFTTPFRNKMRPGFSPQHSFPGNAMSAGMPMYSASPLGARSSMPSTPMLGPRASMGMTPQQQQALMQRQKFEIQIATDKKLLEHVASIWAVEEKDRERDKKLAEDARRLREAESRASVETWRAMGALQLATTKTAACDSRLAAIRAQIEALQA